MQSKAKSVKEYILELPEERQEVIQNIRSTILKNLPEGFEETMQYGMIAYVVPLSTYPSGYRNDKNTPLPFLALASQKNNISFYHMGIYGDKDLLEWFTKEYKARSKSKLDIGKSCIRFRDRADIPLDLIGELVSKITPSEWIKFYENRK